MPFPERDRFPSEHTFVPVSDRGVILEQLGLILSSPLFRQSKRCTPMLRYLVMETVEGRGFELEELSIGIAVFGHQPQYGTTEDLTIRGLASEIRKRLTQYYQEPGHEWEVRIELPHGSYMPHFFQAPSMPEALTIDITPQQFIDASSHRKSRTTRSSREVSDDKWRRTLTWAGLGVGLLLIAALAVTTRFDRQDATTAAFNAFWRPILDSDHVILAVGDPLDKPMAESLDPTVETSIAEISELDKVGFADGVTMARIAALLRTHNASYEMRRARSLTVKEVGRASTVLIGNVKSAWTRLVTTHPHLRFTWDQPEGTLLLRDLRRPKAPLWQLDPSRPYVQLDQDQAIVSRLIDPHTEKPMLLIAGSGRDAVLAAGEFITEPKYVSRLTGSAPAEWSHKNLQLVIATDLVNGEAGPPRLVAAHYW